MLTASKLAFWTLAYAALPAVTGTHVNWKNLKSPAGDGIPDFSYCGYHASNDKLPSMDSDPTKTLWPSMGGNQSQTIQNALNEISTDGGGTLLLKAGVYNLTGTLTIPDHTVLRGEGRDKTILRPPNANAVFVTMGATVETPLITPVANITDEYVPVGASTFNLNDASCLWIGETIMVQRNVTSAWVAANGMNDLYRNGTHQTWLPTTAIVSQPRTIKCINRNQVTVDVPLADSLNTVDMLPQVAAYTYPNASSEMGLENLGILLDPTCSGAPLSGTGCLAHAVGISAWSSDSWIRDVDIIGFNAAVDLPAYSMRITLDSVNVYRTGPTNPAAGYAFDISVAGIQALVKDCATFGDADAQNYPIGTQSLTPGPNAVVSYYSQQENSPIQPHQRWAFGFLVDVSNAAMSFIDRDVDGSGHGWTINAGVIWNSIASELSVSSPPTGTNWCIGCRSGGINDNGNKTAIIQNGTFISGNVTVSPRSLFAAQLHERLNRQ